MRGLLNRQYVCPNASEKKNTPVALALHGIRQLVSNVAKCNGRVHLLSILSNNEHSIHQSESKPMDKWREVAERKQLYVCP